MKLELLKTCGGLCGWFLHCDRNLHFPCLKVEVATRANGVREKGVEKEGVASPVTLPLFQRLNQRHHPFQHPSHLINTFNQHASVQRPLYRCELIIPCFLGYNPSLSGLKKEKRKEKRKRNSSTNRSSPVVWLSTLARSLRPHLSFLNSIASFNCPQFNTFTVLT